MYSIPSDGGERGSGERGGGERGSGERGSGESGGGERGSGERGSGERGGGNGSLPSNETAPLRLLSRCDDYAIGAVPEYLNQHRK